jgi:hypothetical protein
MSYPIGVTPAALIEDLYREGSIGPQSSDAAVRFALDIRGFRDAGYVRQALAAHHVHAYEARTGHPF